MPRTGKKRRRKEPGQFKGRKERLRTKNAELLEKAQCALQKECELAHENVLLKRLVAGL